MMKKSSLSLLMNAKVLRYTYHRVHCYSKVYMYTFVNDYI